MHDPDRSASICSSSLRARLRSARRNASPISSRRRQPAPPGLLFVHPLPRDQVEGHYSPYPGVQFGVPACTSASMRARGAARRRWPPAAATVTSTIRSRRMAPTRTVVTATARPVGRAHRHPEPHRRHERDLGQRPDRHPGAGRVLRALPGCRPRTLEFVFTTAHLHLSHAGAEQYAEMLDHDYDDGTVALVVAMEHLGAREFAAVPRADGGAGAGWAHRPSEMFATFAIESPVLSWRSSTRSPPTTCAARSCCGAPTRRSRLPAAPQLRRRGRAVPGAARTDGRRHHRAVDAVRPGLRHGRARRLRADAAPDACLRRPRAGRRRRPPTVVIAGADPVYRIGRDLTEGVPLPTVPAVVLPTVP